MKSRWFEKTGILALMGFCVCSLIYREYVLLLILSVVIALSYFMKIIHHIKYGEKFNFTKMGDVVIFAIFLFMSILLYSYVT